MNNDYRQGYRDGFEDGMKAKEKTHLDNPSGCNPNICAVCNRDYRGSTQYFLCMRRDCPKATWTVSYPFSTTLIKSE